MALSERLALLITANGTQAMSEFQKVGTAASASMATADTSSRRLSASLTRTGIGFVTMGGLAAFGMYKAAQAASEQVEAQNKVQEVFRESSSTVEDWANKQASSFGISEEGALNYAGALGSAMVAQGVADQSAADMSVSLVELAADMASFNDQDPTLMLQKIQSAMAGQPRPLLAYGAALTATNVEQFAFNNGIAAQGEELTTQQKILARYGLLMEQTSRQQGDFQRTLGESAPNQIRVLSAEWDNLVSTLGMSALPVLMQVTQGLNGMMSAVGAADAVTGGMLGTLMTWGAVGAVAVGGILLISGQVLKLKATFHVLQAAMAATRVGAMMLTPAFARVGAAMSVIALAAYANSLNEVTLELDGISEASDDAVAGMAAGWENMPDWVSESDKLATFRESAESNIVAAERFGEAWAAAGGPAEDIDRILREVAEASSATADEQDGAAEATARLAGEFDEGAAAANAQAEALDELMGRIDEYADRLMSVPEAADALEGSFNDLYGSIMENGTVWAGSSAAALDNRAALRDVVASHIELIGKMNENGASQGRMQARTRQTVDRLREARDAGLITGQQFQNLKRQVENVPGVKRIDVSSNVSAVAGEFRALAGAIRDAAQAAYGAEANRAANTNAAQQERAAPSRGSGESGPRRAPFRGSKNRVQPVIVVGGMN